MYKSYLMFFSPEGLLAAGNWPGATKKEYDMHFWHPRFLIDVPPSLIRLVFPFLGSNEAFFAQFWTPTSNDQFQAMHWLKKNPSFVRWFVNLSFYYSDKTHHVSVWCLLTENLERRVQMMGGDARNSMRSAVGFFQYLAIVLVQDAAAGMASEYADHPVHKLLLENAEFR